PRPPRFPLFPYPPPFRSPDLSFQYDGAATLGEPYLIAGKTSVDLELEQRSVAEEGPAGADRFNPRCAGESFSGVGVRSHAAGQRDRKSTRLNSSHGSISY